MIRRFLAALVVVVAALACNTPGSAPTPPTFNNWYISTSGNDSNSGTSFGSAWATPNHAGLTCGDIIHVAAGAYTDTNFGAITQAVSCPSSNNVVWVKCDTAFTCTETGQHAFLIQNSFWGVQGFLVTNANGNPCYSSKPAGSATIGYVVFANNIANGCWQGGITTFNVGINSVDNVAVIGNALYNGSQSNGVGAVCGSGLSIGGPRNDASTNHLMYVAWNIAWGNKSVRCLGQNLTTNATTAAGNAVLHFSTSPGTSYIGFEVIDTTTPGALPANAQIANAGTNTLTMNVNAIGPGVGSADVLTLSQNSDNTGVALDTWNSYTGTGVVENNLLVGNGTSGYEIVATGAGPCSTTLSRFNTVANNMAMPNAYGGGGSNSDINAGGGLTNGCMTLLNNVVQNIRGNPISSAHAKGVFWSPNGSTTPDGMMDNNFTYSSVTGNQGALYWGVGSSCLAGHTCSVGGGANCPSITNTANAGCSGNSFTTAPSFVSETIPGAPSCSGFATVAACMATTWANWKATNVIAAAWGHTNAAPTDGFNNTPFLCNIYHNLPAGIVPTRC